MRGDEPGRGRRKNTNVTVFPTCVGMNRRLPRSSTVTAGVPHMRGDEPYYRPELDAGMACSPHAWG